MGDFDYPFFIETSVSGHGHLTTDVKKMKPFIIILFLSAFITWLAEAGDVRLEVAAVNSPSEDYLSIWGSDFDVEGGGYSTCSIDLNGDGLEDRMFANAGTSGTGGTEATVYLARNDGRYTRVGTLGHRAISAEGIMTGARFLHCSWKFGCGATWITTYLISHHGLKRIGAIQGIAAGAEPNKRYETVFASPLKPDYKFVARRPRSKAEQGAGGKRD